MTRNTVNCNRFFLTPFLSLLLLFMAGGSVIAQTAADYLKLYWPNYNENRIERINFDGTGRETMIADASSVSGYGIIGLQVDVPNQKIYWFDDGAKTIERANFDGTGRETFVANPGYSYTIIIDHQNQQVYWPNYDANSIERINLDGTDRETVVEEIAAGGAGAISIALDNINNKIYWFEDGALSIQRANKDGTGVETFLVGPGYSYSIVIPQDAEGTLPLRLVSFTANPGPGGVLLQWSTAEEVNTAFFGIERAFNGGEFITIGNLNANASEGRYHFADTRVTAKGAYHYRLKMIDKDGKFKYSPTVPVQYGGQTAGDYFLYPNPAVGSFIYLKAPANAASDLPVRILDITGKSWYQHTVSPVNGRYDIPVGSLPAGSYLLMIKPENEGNWKTLKFSK